MSKVLSMSSRQHIDEMDVFRALVKWLKAACVKNKLEGNSVNMKAMGDNLINLIRYTFIPIRFD